MVSIRRPTQIGKGRLTLKCVMARCRRVFSPRHIGASFCNAGSSFAPFSPRPVIPSVSLLLGRPGTPTPTPPAACPTIRPPSRTTPTTAQRRATGAAGIPLARRRAHKGKVDVHGLVQQLGAVGAVDGRAGLLEGRVLDQRVALANAERGLVTNHGVLHTDKQTEGIP